jgi:hypothetical protein
MGMKYTKEALQDIVKNFKKPVPFYDGTDEATRKEIGKVIHVEWVNDDHVEFLTELKDTRIVRSRWA